MSGTFGTLVPADLEIFFTGLDASYSSVYATTASWASQLATMRPSSSTFERYGWMDRIPTLREWIGPRVVHGVQTETLFVENKLFELTMSVDKYKLMADEWGLFSNLAQQMGWQSAKWKDQKIAAAILANINGTDGLSFFSDSHPIDFYKSGSAVYSNLHVSRPLTPDNFNFGRYTMMSQVAQDGQPLGVVPNLLVCAPALEYKARNILNASFIAPQTVGGATQVGTNDNVLKGMCDLLVLPELAENVSQVLNQTSYPGDDDDWYLADTRMPVKPITFQTFQEPTLVARVSPQDPQVFNQHQFLYGVEAYGAPVLTFPFLMHKFLNGSS